MSEETNSIPSIEQTTTWTTSGPLAGGKSTLRNITPEPRAAYNEFLTPADVAKRLGISAKAARRMFYGDRQTIPTVRIGRRRKMHLRDFEKRFGSGV